MTGRKHDPKYDAYIEHAMKIGEATNWSTFDSTTWEERHDRDRFVRMLDEQVDLFEHEDTCLAAGKCPGCGGALSRTVDERQVGPVELELRAGTWFNYRCATDPPIGEPGPRTCPWRGIDRKEPIGEN
jgi:hypothetical protein